MKKSDNNFYKSLKHVNFAQLTGPTQSRINHNKNEERIMILSMTGFGRGSASTSKRKISVEIKALNSKQLDLIIKVPNRYRCLEGELRNTVAKEAERGKIETVVSIELTGQEVAAPLNIDLIGQYKKQIEQLAETLGIDTPQDWYATLLRMPDVMKSEDAEISEEEAAAFTNALKEALANMIEFRKDEGEKLYRFFQIKIENIRKLLGEIAPFEESRVAKIRSRLLEQLDKLSGVEVDQGRLEQELIYYIEKLDVTEEKQRLTTHLDYFLQTMGEPKVEDLSPKGKKLGFIAQEMGREINTLGSKSNNAEMQIVVVKMKDELEQIKEQVLNVL